MENVLEKKFSELTKEEKIYVQTYTAIVAEIQKKIEEMKLKNSDFAKITGIRRSNVDRILKMESSPRLFTLLKVAHGLGIELKIKEKEE